jgi:hypothetical protein
MVKAFLSDQSRPVQVIDRVAAFLPRGNGPIVDCLLSFLPGSCCTMVRVASTFLPDEPDAALHEFVWANERAARSCAPGFIEDELAARSGQCAQHCLIGAHACLLCELDRQTVFALHVKQQRSRHITLWLSLCAFVFSVSSHLRRPCEAPGASERPRTAQQNARLPWRRPGVRAYASARR